MPKVELLGFDAKGAPSPELTPSNVYAADADANPFPSRFESVEPGRLTWHRPDDRGAQLWVFWTVEGFGRVWLPATIGSDEAVVSEALARTRRAEVQVVIDDCAALGIDAPPDVTGDLVEADTLLARAEGRSAPERSMFADQALAKLLWAGERAVLARAKERIRRTPDKVFRLGANFFGYPKAGDEYAARFVRALNFATLPFYLGSFEPECGKPDYGRCAGMAKFLHNKGLRSKGHPLIWFYNGTTPQWQRDLYAAEGYDGLLRQCTDRVRDCALEYIGLIGSWDIINEAHGWANSLGLTLEQLVDITRAGCAAGREANPRAELVVNNCCLDGAYVARGHDHEGPAPAERLCTPLQYMRNVEDAGTDYDVLGLQLYYPSRDLLQIERIMDRFARFGKPIHITEVAVPSSMTADNDSFWKGEDSIRNMGVWRRPWDEDVQAEWVEAFYTLCRGHPSVEAVTWWDFADYIPGHFFPHGGFLRPDMSPKPAYEVLLRLREEWGA